MLRPQSGDTPLDLEHSSSSTEESGAGRVRSNGQLHSARLVPASLLCVISASFGALRTSHHDWSDHEVNAWHPRRSHTLWRIPSIRTDSPLHPTIAIVCPGVCSGDNGSRYTRDARHAPYAPTSGNWYRTHLKWTHRAQPVQIPTDRTLVGRVSSFSGDDEMPALRSTGSSTFQRHGVNAIAKIAPHYHGHMPPRVPSS